MIQLYAAKIKIQFVSRHKPYHTNSATAFNLSLNFRSKFPFRRRTKISFLADTWEATFDIPLVSKLCALNLASK